MDFGSSNCRRFENSNGFALYFGKVQVGIGGNQCLKSKVQKDSG